MMNTTDGSPEFVGCAPVLFKFLVLSMGDFEQDWTASHQVGNAMHSWRRSAARLYRHDGSLVDENSTTGPPLHRSLE